MNATDHLIGKDFSEPIIDKMYNGLAIVDSNLNFAYTNEAFEVLVKRGNLEGTSLLRLFFLGDKDEATNYFESYFDSPDSREVIFRGGGNKIPIMRSDSVRIHCYIGLSSFQKNSNSYMSMTFRDTGDDIDSSDIIRSNDAMVSELIATNKGLQNQVDTNLKLTETAGRRTIAVISIWAMILIVLIPGAYIVISALMGGDDNNVSEAIQLMKDFGIIALNIIAGTVGFYIGRNDIKKSGSE